jgi:hypothetical protein
MNERLSAARRLRGEQRVPRGEKLTTAELDDEVVGAGGLSYDHTVSAPTVKSFKKLKTEAFRCDSPELIVKRVPVVEDEFLDGKRGDFYAYVLAPAAMLCSRDPRASGARLGARFASSQGRRRAKQ